MKRASLFVLTLSLFAAIATHTARPASAGFPGFVVEPTWELSTFQSQFEVAAVDAFFMSEADLEPFFIAQPLADRDAPLTGEIIFETFANDIEAFYTDEHGDLPVAELAFEASDNEMTFDMLASLSDAEGSDEEFIVDGAAAWMRITTLFGQNLTELMAIKVGFAVDGELGVDRGLYAWLIVGKTPTGELAGLLVGSVET